MSTDSVHKDDVEWPVRRATIGESSSTTSELSPIPAVAGRTRRKSITTACERCRRRKIRCDGNQPCATCARFMVNCVRPSKHRERFGPDHSFIEHREQQAALEDRVRRLETQLAETRMQSNLNDTEDLFSDWQGEDDDMSMPHLGLRLDTDMSHPQRSFSYDDQLGNPFLGHLTPTDIPMIEITGCESPFPRPLSPSPSMLSASGISRTSTPDAYTATTPASHPAHLVAPNPAVSISPPVSPQGRVNTWDFAGMDDFSSFLSPSLGIVEEGMSRRSSISSLGLDQDLSAMNLAFPDFFDNSQLYGQSTGTFTQLHHSPPQMPSRDTGSHEPYRHVALSKPEAQQLTEIFFAKFAPMQAPINRDGLQICLEAVYSLPDFSSAMTLEATKILSSVPSCSLDAAKFQVFIILATALRMVGAPIGSSNAARCEALYGLAMQQTLSSRFWNKDQGVEMALLLAVFAKACSTG
ncbi:hypothetical protein EJ05DRAFT_486800 [Pseudovirgaria hyperparasitica]|uniref:Zn(2)-C6 fungal-type domain-containing protein n=1 Tax=Pseudovirgaria hyperparasitica TaxID=470096 RepID=A0A6A6W9M2_9PEZI|nr:uncharacterized protein EJ05DRAFT_486800 [Pseudovirgaria hyperparasitica]KAF2757791.1 hypothetical protein EJ05DRAFT_486800 [Pseudovirgaria hyperparasitica]